MAEKQERRSAPRVEVAERLDGRARATLEVHLLDLSTSGARIRHHDILRPGVTYALELPPPIGGLVVSIQVVRTVIVGTEQSPTGERLLRYESGVIFTGITANQQAILEASLKRLTPGGGLGNGRLGT